MVPALCLFLLIPCGCNATAVISLLVVTQMGNGAVTMSHMQNIHDLSPNFASSIYGIMCALCGGTGYLAPWAQGLILHTFVKQIYFSFYLLLYFC